MPGGRISTGACGEDAAAAWLATNGFDVLSRRQRVAGVEVDILAVDRARRTLVLVEVKTRRVRHAGAAERVRPEESLGLRQLTRLARAASALERCARARGLALRIDSIAVCLEPTGRATVRHIPDVSAGLPG